MSLAFLIYISSIVTSHFMEREHLVWEDQRLVRDSEWEYEPVSKMWYAMIPKDYNIMESLGNIPGSQMYVEYNPDYQFPYYDVWFEWEYPKPHPKTSSGYWEPVESKPK